MLAKLTPPAAFQRNPRRDRDELRAVDFQEQACVPFMPRSIGDQHPLGKKPPGAQLDRLLDRAIARIRMPAPQPARASACGHHTSTPTPFKKIDRKITRK